MKILEIVSMDMEAKEADILVGGDEVSILCYVHPIEDPNNLDQLKWSLFAYLADRVQVSECKHSFAIKTGHSYYSHAFCGRKISDDEIQVGSLKISVGRIIPGDICLNEYVCFECMRVDVVFEML